VETLNAVTVALGGPSPRRVALALCAHDTVGTAAVAITDAVIRLASRRFLMRRDALDIRWPDTTPGVPDTATGRVRMLD
jgi:hypothetical protein